LFLAIILKLHFWTAIWFYSGDMYIYKVGFYGIEMGLHTNTDQASIQYQL